MGGAAWPQTELRKPEESVSETCQLVAKFEGCTKSTQFELLIELPTQKKYVSDKVHKRYYEWLPENKRTKASFRQRSQQSAPPTSWLLAIIRTLSEIWQVLLLSSGLILDTQLQNCTYCSLRCFKPTVSFPILPCASEKMSHEQARAQRHTVTVSRDFVPESAPDATEPIATFDQGPVIQTATDFYDRDSDDDAASGDEVHILQLLRYLSDSSFLLGGQERSCLPRANDTNGFP